MYRIHFAPGLHNTGSLGSKNVRLSFVVRPLPGHRLDRTHQLSGVEALDDTHTADHMHKVGFMNRLLQNINIAGSALFLKILNGDQSLAIPHIAVPDITWINWSAMKQAGFKLCIFDKDNTLCEPFALAVDPNLLPSVQASQQAFGSNIVLYSNSAGLMQYDPHGEEAAALEAAFGIHVLRHKDKKPAGGCQELQQQFMCEPHEMVFVGDRYLTDVVYGNRHGMLTIRVAPLTSKGEPPAVAAARLVEEACVRRWGAQGIKAPLNQLLPHEQCSKLVKQQQQQATTTMR